jgi:hypothetical protein
VVVEKVVVVVDDSIGVGSRSNDVLRLVSSEPALREVFVTPPLPLGALFTAALAPVVLVIAPALEAEVIPVAVVATPLPRCLVTV